MSVDGKKVIEILFPKAEVEPGVTVVTRDGKQRGKTTGASCRCRMSGCTGVRVTVKWPWGQFTHPCSRGMRRNKKSWRIL